MIVMSEKSDRLTVLLASKDTFFTEMVLRILHENGYPVVVTESCGEALEYMLDKEFDFVIMDPDLEPLMGSDAIKIVKKLKPNIPLITVNDESSFETGIKIAETGVFFRLGKPVDEKMTKDIVKLMEKKK